MENEALRKKVNHIIGYALKRAEHDSAYRALFRVEPFGEVCNPLKIAAMAETGIDTTNKFDVHLWKTLLPVVLLSKRNGNLRFPVAFKLVFKDTYLNYMMMLSEENRTEVLAMLNDELILKRIADTGVKLDFTDLALDMYYFNNNTVCRWTGIAENKNMEDFSDVLE